CYRTHRTSCCTRWTGVWRFYLCQGNSATHVTGRMPPITDSTARVAGDLIPAAQHPLQIDACHDLKKSAIDSFSTALRRMRPPTYPDPRSSEFLLDARSEIRRRHGVQLVTERAHGLLEPSEAGVLRFALGIEARKRLQIPGRQSNA